jgi:hypothetical protein
MINSPFAAAIVAMLPLQGRARDDPEVAIRAVVMPSLLVKFNERRR